MDFGLMTSKMESVGIKLKNEVAFATMEDNNFSLSRQELTRDCYQSNQLKISVNFLQGESTFVCLKNHEH